MSKSVIDIIVAAGLGVALLLVLGLDKILPQSKNDAPKLEQVVEPPAPTFKKLRLAVSLTAIPKNDWDKMGLLLNTLGEGYKFTEIPIQDLRFQKTLDDIDVFFLTCSNEGNEPGIAENLRRFVSRGGTLYASDWQYMVVAKAFPERVAQAHPDEGRNQNLVADVKDEGLRDALGTAKVDLTFDLPEWKTAAFAGQGVKVLMQASYLPQKGLGRKESPLLVKFGFDKGTVIFTSFHNERQNSEVETKLLKFLVFSAVTAQIENEIHSTMLKGGFSPQKSNLFSASGKQEIEKTYQSKKAGKVRFTLGFQDPDNRARLKLTVTSPDGKKRVQEGTYTFFIEETSATAGEWKYTLEALAVPYPDFPFTLTVGESD